MCRSTSPFDDAFVVSWRREAVKKLLNDYKFESRREAGVALAYLLDVAVPILPAETRVAPIPTLGKHVRQRSFDHVGLIASHFAKRRRMTLIDPLSRISTAVQHGGTRQQRIKQAKTMFALKDQPVEGPIVLIDDIYTTGSTVHEAAKLLRTKTDQPIYLALIARQPVGEDE